MRPAAPFLALIIGTAPAPALAGQACWGDNGAVVVSASLGAIAGDFILDPATPISQIHDTRAEAAGFEAPVVRGELRLAGRRLGQADFEVTALDARAWGFPTEITGVIGADVLDGRVVDLSARPRRIAIRGPRAPRFHGRWRLRLKIVDGRPTVTATASDGSRKRKGAFALETGGAGVRLSAQAAALSRPPPAGADPASRSRPPARLRGLILAGAGMENLPAGLDPAAPPGLLGDIGETVWSRYAMRIDLRRQRLELKPARCDAPKGGPSPQLSPSFGRGEGYCR